MSDPLSHEIQNEEHNDRVAAGEFGGFAPTVPAIRAKLNREGFNAVFAWDDMYIVLEALDKAQEHARGYAEDVSLVTLQARRQEMRAELAEKHLATLRKG